MQAPSHPLDRRGFLVRTAALLGAGVTAACDVSPLTPDVGIDDPSLALHGQGILHLFANESGLFTDRDPFVVGLLLTDSPGPHARALADLRTSLGHFTELSYSSTDRFKEAYAEAALDHFFSSEDLQFAAVVTNASRSAGGVDTTGLYEELLRALAGDGSDVTLHLEERFLDPAPDATLEGRLEGVDVEFVPSHESDLLQLGDLLTGSVRGDMTRAAEGSGGNVKDRLIASLKERLNVQRLVDPSMTDRAGFNVQVLHPPF